MLSTFPHLTTSEFNKACVELQEKFQKQGHRQGVWTCVEIIHQNDTKYLRITKALKTESTTSNIEDRCNVQGVVDNNDDDDDVDELEETDNEALSPSLPQPLIHYDITLSPTYLVPTLYIHISDPLHCYPPTMSTLRSHLIPPEYRSQIDSVGVMGGVSITDHPVIGRPVFFIHPCQTAGVIQATVGGKEVTAAEYLVAWIGALGGCVGLNMPLGLVRGDGESRI